MGLGNPGRRYRNTRHNVGFDAVDRILESAGGGAWRRWDEAACAEALLEGESLDLMKPLTYMNLSGGPVAEWVKAHSLSKEQILVYYDDIALPLGRIRLRQSGGDGGHRGLASVLEALEGKDVPRMRIGILPAGEAGPEDLVDFVLSPFTNEEREALDGVLDRVVSSTRMILSDGLDRAMSRYNAPD